MDQQLKMTRKQLLIAAAVLILILLVVRWQWQAAEERRRDDEIATAEGLARIVGTTFTGTTDLRVAVLAGTVDVTSVYHGRIFDSKLKATFPASVDYFVDLSALSLRKVRFDKVSRTLFVEVPNVRMAEPNIDFAKANLSKPEGPWVSREASATLMKRAVKLADQKAAEESAKLEFIEKARAEGRQRISELLALPLEASEMRNVRVAVRYPSDAGKIDQRWDVSRSIQDILDEAEQGRAGEQK